jgi:hypothetical protein
MEAPFSGRDGTRFGMDVLGWTKQVGLESMGKFALESLESRSQTYYPDLSSVVVKCPEGSRTTL